MKFETINNTLCRMVEPEPLTPEAQFPCVVRLIQDDSPMGRYNRDAAYFDVIGKLFVAQKIKENPFYSNTLHAYEKNSLNQDYCIASIHTLEIIGYPVDEGSRWWALYQAENGKSFEHKTAHHCRIFTMFSETELRVTNEEGEVVEFVDIDRFLSEGAKDGWQLYEPRPLLADAQVGDLCQTRGEGYHLISDVYTDQRKYAYERNCGDTIYVYENGMFNLINHEHPFDIIHTEPLAPEGSAEWAWQMLILQKPVSHPAEGIWRDTYYSKDGFVRCMAKTGWQLYEEKPEPPKEPYYVICKRCGGTGYAIKEPDPATAKPVRDLLGQQEEK